MRPVTAERRRAIFAIAIAGLCAIGVGVLAAKVAGQGWQSFDRNVLLSLRQPTNPSDPRGPLWFEEMVRDVSALGSAFVLTLVSVVAVSYAALRRSGRDVRFVALASLGGQAVTFALKEIVARDRPHLVPHGSMVYTQSFPSGHSMMSSAVYVALAVAAARLFPDRRSRLLGFGIAALLALLIGASRVYLGVHWPTDVLGGWLGGVGWALVCWAVRLWMDAPPVRTAPGSRT